MQVEYKTKKGIILFIKVPDDAYNIELSADTIFGFNSKIQNPMGMNWDYHVVEKGFELIGLSNEVTEGQAKVMFSGISTAQLDGVFYSIGKGERYFHEDALSAFKYTMNLLRLFEVNPYIEVMNTQSDWTITKEEWFEAKERTGKWILLFKNHEQNNI